MGNYRASDIENAFNNHTRTVYDQHFSAFLRMQRRAYAIPPASQFEYELACNTDFI